MRSPRSFLALLVLAILLVVAGCGGGGEEKAQQEPKAPEGAEGGAKGGQKGDAKGGAKGGSTAGGSTVASPTAAETLEDSPFTLNQRQPVPQDFRQAYQRRALIVVEFFKPKPDSDEGIEYPQGIRKVDGLVNRDLDSLRGKYPEIEFFTYDITRPGNAETSEDLDRGEYGTLAAQLEVGYTPFIAMLAPRGEEYVVENLFQGYVERGVLDQALFDLASTDVGGNSSDVEVSLEQVELTESGNGIEYFTVLNEGNEEADLSGFTLNVVDPETGGPAEASEGVQITGQVRLSPGEEASIGRASNVVDADGRAVVGTFSGGSLTVKAGDRVVLLDNGGAVVSDISI